LLACHGEIESVLSIPLNDAYTTPRRLTSTLMSLGAGELTVFAPIALGGIYGKRLWGHGSVLSQVVGVPLFFVQHSERLLVNYYNVQKCFVKHILIIFLKYNI
jgi:hypothetical protein